MTSFSQTLRSPVNPGRFNFKIMGWGWYYLSTILDGYSRFIIAWILTSSMQADDVKNTLELAVTKAGVSGVKIRHRPRLLSDNGPCYLAGDLKTYLEEQGIEHTRGPLSSHDPGQDRALPPHLEECG